MIGREVLGVVTEEKRCRAKKVRRKFVRPKGKSLQRRENRYREEKIITAKEKLLPKAPLSLP